MLTDFDESEEMFSLKQQINAKFSARFPTRAKMNVVSTTIQRKKEDVAARTLQRAWQMFKTQQVLTLAVDILKNIIIMYIYCALITAPSAHIVHINLNIHETGRNRSQH